MKFARPMIAACAATFAAALPVSNSAAQSADQVREAFVKFSAAQRSLGMNESCEVLDHSEMQYANMLVSELETPLSRVLGEIFKPDEIRETGRELFEGCKSRSDAPEAWQQIDFVKQMSAASVLAASLIPMSPDDCVVRPHIPVTAAQLKTAADRAIASLQPEQRAPVQEAAKNMLPAFELGCVQKKDYIYPSVFRPALAKVMALGQLRTAQAGQVDASLASIKDPRPSDTDEWIGPWKSYFMNYRMGDYSSVTAYRTHSPGKAVAKFHVSAGGTFRGSGHIYFTRAGKIEAAFDEDFDTIVLRSAEEGASYVLMRTNPDVKPDFFGKTRAEFAMPDDVLNRFMRENDEKTDFTVFYRPEAKSGLRPFVIGPDKNSVKVNLGDLVRAYRWGMAPSAI